MARITIPLRPESRFKNLSEEEKDCLTWMVLSRKSKLECFTTFVRPDLKGSRVAQQWCDQFFSVGDVRNYLKEYEETLKDYFAPKKKETKRDKELNAEQALNTFKENVIEAVNKEGVTDVGELSDQAQLLNRIGLLKEEMEKHVPPIRVLTERCNRCEYKLFIDKQIELGNIVEDEGDD